MRPVRPAALLAVACLGLTACAGEQDPGVLPGEPRSETRTNAATTEAAPPPTTPAPSPTSEPPEPERPDPRVSPRDLRAATAVDAVGFLAGEVGPRPGHTEAFFRAAAWAERRLTAYGWTVERQRFPTPGGVSWGVPVDAGPSVNLVATRGAPARGEEWLLVGAHLDTVPQAPGAEDNASGVGVVLAVAEALQERRTRLPVVLVLFGSEEPRGEGDDDHHFGSRAYVDALAPAQRRTLAGMVSLDRVGVGSVVPVQTVGDPNGTSDELVAAAGRVGVPTDVQPGEASSDHESFADQGLPAARLGSTPYAGYHSPDDVPSVVDRAQLERVGRVVLAWLR